MGTAATPTTRCSAPAGCSAAAPTGSPTRQRQRLDAALDAGDPTGQVTAAWLVAQHLMAAYATPDRTAGRAAAEHAITLALTCPVPEITRLGRTLRGWRTEYLARFDQPDVSNGPTECLNLKVKNTKRVARGYRSFRNYRLRLLLNPMPLTYEVRVDDRDRRGFGVADGVVGGLFAGEFSCGSFEDPRVGSSAAGRVEQFADFGDGLAESSAAAVRGKRPPGR